MNTWYRYEDVVYAAPADEFGESRGLGTLHVHLREYNVVRTTAKGVWLNLGGPTRFVLTGARRRFACPTVEQAYESFKARKRRQLGIYNARAQRAQRALDEIDRITRPDLVTLNRLEQLATEFLAADVARHHARMPAVDYRERMRARIADVLTKHQVAAGKFVEPGLLAALVAVAVDT